MVIMLSLVCLMLVVSLIVNVVLLDSNKKHKEEIEKIKKNSDYQRYKDLQKSHDIVSEAFEELSDCHNKWVEAYENLVNRYNELNDELVNSREYEADDEADVWRKLNDIINASIYDRELYDKLININSDLFEGLVVIDNSLAEYETDEEGNIVAIKNLDNLQWYFLSTEDLVDGEKFYFDYVSEINEPQVETYM